MFQLQNWGLQGATTREKCRRGADGMLNPLVGAVGVQHAPAHARGRGWVGLGAAQVAQRTAQAVTSVVAPAAALEVEHPLGIVGAGLEVEGACRDKTTVSPGTDFDEVRLHPWCNHPPQVSGRTVLQSVHVAALPPNNERTRV